MNSPVVLSIAGSDNSGGAGIQADLKTFCAFRCYGTTAITCIVAEHPGRVKSIEPVSSIRVQEQIDLVAEAFSVGAFKTGMLFSEEIIQAVFQSIETHLQGIPFVLDPVMVASSGASLLKPEAIQSIQRDLIPKAAVVTPNRDEAALLWGQPIADLESMRVAGKELTERYGVPFLMKGGHLKTEDAVDLLFTQEGEESFVSKRIPNVDPHGTGCTYSAAITCGLAQGLSLSESISNAKRYMTQAIESHFESRGYQVLNHFVR
ncbi:MAG: bifunctional hydroxymethylpyrimidine kinase/phosphomethylpyrimidine kinase [Verrucomicrobiota bacterium]